MDPRVAEAVWKAIEGHLPPRPPDMHPLGCHRLRIPDRDCFDGILVRLVTGCSWDVAARLCKASETTLRARRTEWLAAGVFDKLVEEAIAGYDRIIDGANRNDSILLEPTLQAVAARGLLLDIETLHLDRGYDSALTTQRCHGLG